MILHAVMADQVFESEQTAGRIIIRSPDTESVFKAIYDHSDDFTDLLTLNSEDDASALQAARKLTSALYDPKAKRTDAILNLNNFRVKLASKKNASLIKLPPCEASFTQHVRRAWQTKIWMTSHIAMQDTGSP